MLQSRRQNLPTIGEHVIVIFVAQQVAIETVWSAKSTLHSSFKGL